VVLLYLLIIVCQSLAGGFVVSAAVALAAAVCLDFFFLPPVLSMHIADPLDALAFVVFLAIGLVTTHLVTRLHTAAHGAQRRGANLEQLHRAAQQLLFSQPDLLGPASLLRNFRENFVVSAVCLFDGDTAESHIEGTPACDLPERTRKAFVAGK